MFCHYNYEHVNVMWLRLIASILFVSHYALTTNEINSLYHSGKNESVVSQCLQQNNAEAIWLPETGVMQDLGIDQIPDPVQMQVLEKICDMNEYYRNSVQSQDACRLAESRCQNQQPLCAFWATQGQCTNANYSNYMEANCPVACRLCHTELFRARAWLDFLKNLQHVYDEPRVNVVARRQHVLDQLLTRLGISPNRSGHFAEKLVRRLDAVIPSVLGKLYLKEALTEQETIWLRQLYTLDPKLPAEQVQMSALMQYRERGHIVGLMEATDHLILRPIQLSIAFAIPNAQALQTLRELNRSILEMGAGTGYWTALLHNMGVPVVAYDAARGPDNAFFDVWYTDQIRQGTCEHVMRTHPEWAQTHALLLIWPNDPDPIDHPQFCHGGACHDSEPVWDVPCLQAYMKNGGTTVVYVGERQRVLQDRYGTNESGMSSTLQFQQLLEESFDLRSVVSIPQLWLNDDDLTVWTRKPSLEKDEL